MASGPGNCDNENESTSVIVSVQQCGRSLVPADSPLCVFSQQPDHNNDSRDLSLHCGLKRIHKHFKVKVPDKMQTIIFFLFLAYFLPNVCIECAKNIKELFHYSTTLWE